MLIIDDLLLWLPIRGIIGVFREVKKQADKEMKRNTVYPKIKLTKAKQPKKK